MENLDEVANGPTKNKILFKKYCDYFKLRQKKDIEQLRTNLFLKKNEKDFTDLFYKHWPEKSKIGEK